VGYVWAAIDVDTRELLAAWASWRRNILNAETFLSVGGMHKQPLSSSTGWYPEALKALGLEWIHETFGEPY
jgi:transposase-like protein